ncbi:MAG: hypothetical protein D6702_11730 [Planctomycetota bacterium]|nr:MAG: hypothetical protein D6702_11730 [Planctomycetota bacterium]
MTVLAVLPFHPGQEAGGPFFWARSFRDRLAEFHGAFELLALAPQAADGGASDPALHRFRWRDQEDVSGPEGVRRLLGRSHDLDAWQAAAVRAASALARHHDFGVVHAQLPLLTGPAARAAGAGRRVPVVAMSCRLELAAAAADPALRARLEREWETCDLLVAGDEETAAAIRSAGGRPVPTLPAGDDPEERVEWLLGIWERALLRGPVRTRPGQDDLHHRL